MGRDDLAGDHPGPFDVGRRISPIQRKKLHIKVVDEGGEGTWFCPVGRTIES
jgi:hypothetical protein